MMDADTIRFIREEVKRQTNIILSGKSGTNDGTKEDIQEMFPKMPTIEDRPVMHPYGFASRAPKGTIQVVARQGDHIGNRLVLGHRASDRPTLGAGESAIYNEHGEVIKVVKGKILAKAADLIEFESETQVTKADEIFLGSDSADEPLVLGTVAKTYLGHLKASIDDLSTDLTMINTQLTTLVAGITADTATLIGSAPVTVGSAAAITAALAVLAAQIAAQTAQRVIQKATFLDTASTNILSQKAFTERGP